MISVKKVCSSDKSLKEIAKRQNNFSLIWRHSVLELAETRQPISQRWGRLRLMESFFAERTSTFDKDRIVTVDFHNSPRFAEPTDSSLLCS